MLNKLDLLGDDADAEAERIVNELEWQGPVYRISALKREGTRKLVGDIMTRLEEIDGAPAQEALQEEDYDPASE